ncbi:MAG: AlpA family transcriptional regulator [Magnetococcales bacterium]|nr:AlpA family transcriptional regulator [Magnetococcales bacterium]
MSYEDTKTFNPNNTDRLLRLRQVMSMTGLSKSGVYLFIKKKNLPPPYKAGPKISVWRESDIQAWINSLSHKWM